MSVPVRLEDLAAALAGYGYAYLVTAGGSGSPHVVAVTPLLHDGVLHVERPGRRTASNAAAHPAVTLAFPPPHADGYTLLVDGEAAGTGEGLTIRPTSAVLHRPAAPGTPPSAGGCGSDCRHVQADSTSSTTGS